MEEAGAQIIDLCAARRLKQDLTAIESHHPFPPMTVQGSPGQLNIEYHPLGHANSIVIGGTQFVYTTFPGGVR
jgi:hypothetical protein